MKNLFSVLFFLTPLFLHGQEIKVNVVFKNEPLPYTYISVNRTPIAITDASGIARIPMDKINLGDTITSSMIGMLPVSLIYDQQIQQNLSCELVHITEDVYNLGEVTATGYGNRSSMRIFRRVAKTHQALLQNCLVNGKFTSEITLSDGTTYPVNGAFVTENNVPKKTKEPFRFYFNTTPAQIETISDTTNLSGEPLRELKWAIPRVYGTACIIISQLNLEHRGQRPNTNMSYLGFKEGRHFFIYSNFYPNRTSVIQILFEVDADSQELINAKLTSLGNLVAISTWTDYYTKDILSDLTINASYQKLNRGRATITVLENTEANIVYRNGVTIDLKIYDTSIKFQ